MLKYPLLIFIISSSIVFASEPVVIDDTLEEKNIGLNIEYLIDADKILTIDKITDKSNNYKWIQSTEKELSLGFKTDVYWVRFTAKNTTGKEIEFYLEQYFPLIDYITLYIPEKNNSYRSIQTGDFFPFSQRPVEYRNFIFPIKIKAHSSKTYYLRFDTTSSITIFLKIASPEAFQKKKDKEAPFLWLYYGILLVMIIYNLFIFFSVKDLSYLYYILHILFFLLFMMSINGISFQYLWPNFTWWANFSIAILVGLLSASLLMFGKYFIGTKGSYPLFNRIINIFVVLNIMAAASSIFNNNKICLVAATAVAGISLFWSLFVLLPYLAFIKKSRQARFFLVAFLMFLIGATLMILLTFGLLPANYITINSLQIGSMFEVVLLSLGLADRINIMRKELKVLNLHLEDKVDQKTEEINYAMDELMAMNDNLINTKKRLETKSIEQKKTAVEMDEINTNLIETLQKLEKTQKNAKRDMKMAANIQESLFPNEPPKLNGWDMAFLFKPMSEVSGDFYDFYETGGELKGLVLSDVSGHGIASGLITMIARSAFFRNFSKNKKLNQIIEDVNKELLHEINKIDNYLTAILLRFNDNSVDYVNAGHPDIILKRSGTGKAETVNIKDRDFRGNYLGVEGLDSPFEVMEFNVFKNDTILLYSDCISKSRNLQNMHYGEKRLTSTFENAPDDSAQHTLDYFMNDFYSFNEGSELNDDLTVIVVKKIL